MNSREIPEIKELYKDYRMKNAEARRALRKLKKVKSKFYFLDIITKPKETDNKDEDIKLEWAVFNLFKSIGFSCEKPKSNRDVDVKVKFKNCYFGIEVKNGNLVGENDMFQANKYKHRYDETYHSLVVYNNSKYNANWDEPRKIDAVKNNYGIITTKELKKGYIKLKNNKISFKQFLNVLNTSGEIKFSNKVLAKL